MCGVLNDVGSFVKDSIGEITSHPLQALGAAAGIPGYDPLIGGLFNSGQGGALISPTGNFTSGAWNDMYQAHPNDAGALGTFGDINAVADKVAPALAGGFASGALSGAGGLESAGETGAGAFSSGLGDTASTLGSMEGGLGGSALYGVGAGTGTAIGGAGADALGAGSLGIAGPSSLGGLTAGAGTDVAALGGSNAGTGLTGYQGGAQLPQGGVDTGNGAVSAEGAQGAAGGGTGAPMGFQQATGGYGGAADTTGASGAGPGNLNGMFGQAQPAATTGSGSPLGYGGQGGQAFNVSTPTAAQGGNGINNIGGSGIGLNDIMNLGKAAQSFWQQRQQASQANNYANSIKGLYAPNSPYAQQMQQTLARQDAAAGRNSQGGTRAVQLAAALTGDQSKALSSSPYASAAQNSGGTQALNGIFNAFGSPQGMASAGRLGSAAFNGLSSLFG